LNRDVWSNPALKSVVKTHFVFSQHEDISEFGKKFIQFYMPRTFPHISIMDPRTGEQAYQFVPPYTAGSILAKITEFIGANDITSTDGRIVTSLGASFPSLTASSGAVPSRKRDREQEELEAAIQASLLEQDDDGDLNTSYSGGRYAVDTTITDTDSDIRSKSPSPVREKKRPKLIDLTGDSSPKKSASSTGGSRSKNSSPKTLATSRRSPVKSKEAKYEPIASKAVSPRRPATAALPPSSSSSSSVVPSLLPEEKKKGGSAEPNTHTASPSSPSVAAELLEEPPPSSDHCRVSIKLPDNKRIVRRVNNNLPLRGLYDLVGTLCSETTSRQFEIIMLDKGCVSNEDATLAADAKLNGQALQVKWIQQ
jgi:hypothetical protein